MPIDVTCPGCQATLRAPDAAAGKKIKCPKCQTVADVPAAAPPAGNQVSAAPPPPPQPLATAAPAPAPPPPRREEESRRRDDDDRRSRRDDDDRPRRRDRDDDDDDRRWRRNRGPRRDAHETEHGTGLQLGLGIGSISLGVFALIFSFMSFCCCSWPFVFGLGSVGLLLGLVGVIVALLAERRGIIIPAIGTGVNIIALVTAVVMIVVVNAWANSNAAAARAEQDRIWQEQQQRNQEAQQRMREEEQRRAEQQRLQKEAERKQREDDFNQKYGNNPTFQQEKTKSQANLRTIAKGLLEYENTYGSLPQRRWRPQGSFGDWSWRVAILPFIGEKNLYDQFKFNEFPDSPTNRKVAANMPAVYAYPRPGSPKDRTHYQLVAGFDGLFNAFNQNPSTKTLGRPAGQTILVVEANSNVEWHQPGNEIEYNAMVGIPPVGGLSGGNFNAAMADGQVYFIARHRYEDAELHKLFNAKRNDVMQNWPPPK
jgi:hypothetical protein